MAKNKYNDTTVAQDDESTDVKVGGFADVLGIILISIPLGVLILVFAGMLAGNDSFVSPPQWLVSGSGKIFTWATGVGGVITLLLRSKGRDPFAYIKWISFVSLGFVAAVLLIARAIPKSADKVADKTVPDVARTLLLHMNSLEFDGVQPKDGPAEIEFHAYENEPENKWDISHEFRVKYGTFAVFPALQEFDFPAGEKKFLATVVRAASAVLPSITTNKSDAEQDHWAICLMPGSAKPESTTIKVNMKCKENVGCKLDGAVPFVKECPNNGRSASLASYFQLHADQTPVAAKQTGQWWRIPTLSTLQKLPNETRPGYTEFSVRSKKLVGIQGADTVTFDLKSNGVNLLIDGLPSGTIALPLKPDGSLAFDFGIETLNFSGVDAGCEHIDIDFRFRKGTREIRTATVSRLYAALRDPLTVTQSLADGSQFEWSGKYHPPSGEGRYEILAGATDKADAAMRWKKMVDDAALTFNGTRMTAIIRPPLRSTPKFGLAIGVVEPNGQVKFTFDFATAKALSEWAKSVKAPGKGTRLFDAAPYVRLNVDRGTPQAGACESAGLV